MAATATASKPRTPKAVAVSKLIGGKIVTQLAKSEVEKLNRARQLCIDLDGINDWQNETRAAADALTALIAKANTGS